MIRFWRIRNGTTRLRLAGRRLFRLTGEEISVFFLNIARKIAHITKLHREAKSLAQRMGLIPRPCKPRITKPATRDVKDDPFVKNDKPVIFVSACVDHHEKGDWKFNGGIKELNYLVKLLRLRGYESYIVTYDGTYEPWLIEHQPHISISEFRDKLNKLSHVRCVTSWAIARSFIQECQNLYFWDMELSFTDHMHLHVLAKLYRTKIKKTAAISRTIQAWHMATFEHQCIVIPNLLDGSAWYPDDATRLVGRIGYMYEGPHTAEYIATIRERLIPYGINLDFYLLRGDEADILSGMRSCDIFLSLNIGKDPLWGEGCPRTIIEALSVGCIVIAFDIIGNRETIVDGYNGIIVERARPDLMAQALLVLHQNPDKVLQMRKNALSLINACHTFDSRWPAIKEFLDL